MTQIQMTQDSRSHPVSRFIALLYGLVAYVAFFGTILYAIGFVTAWWCPRPSTPDRMRRWRKPLIVNLLLMSLFAIQHSVMARRQFKQWWTQFVPKSVERSTYVLFVEPGAHPAVLAVAADAGGGLADRRIRRSPWR